MAARLQWDYEILHGRDKVMARLWQGCDKLVTTL